MPTRKQIDNSHNNPEVVDWHIEYDMMMPFCPKCHEPAYFEDKCCFCGQPFIWKDKPKGYEDTIITIGEWTITQVNGSWGVYIEHNGKEIIHASCSGKISKAKLKEWLMQYVKGDKKCQITKNN